MTRDRFRLRVIGVVLAVLIAACSASGTSDDGSSSLAPPSPASSSPVTSEGSVTTTSSIGTAEAAGGTNDACVALPRATIEEVLGADPGEGELDHAGASTACNYYGDAQVTVEIDPGSDLTGAQASIEAYGDTCEANDGIGDEALFCTGGFPAQGITGQIVWTDGRQTYFVVYNFGDATPSEATMVKLAQRLQP